MNAAPAYQPPSTLNPFTHPRDVSHITKALSTEKKTAGGIASHAASHGQTSAFAIKRVVAGRRY